MICWGQLFQMIMVAKQAALLVLLTAWCQPAYAFSATVESGSESYADSLLALFNSPPCATVEETMLCVEGRIDMRVIILGQGAAIDCMTFDFLSDLASSGTDAIEEWECVCVQMTTTVPANYRSLHCFMKQSYPLSTAEPMMVQRLQFKTR